MTKLVVTFRDVAKARKIVHVLIRIFAFHCNILTLIKFIC